MVLKILRNLKLTINFKNYKQKVSKTLFDKSYIENKPLMNQKPCYQDTIPLNIRQKIRKSVLLKTELMPYL